MRARGLGRSAAQAAVVLTAGLCLAACSGSAKAAPGASPTPSSASASRSASASASSTPGGSTTAPVTSRPAPTPSRAPTPTGSLAPTVAPSIGVTTLAPVASATAADFGNGLSVSVTAATRITTKANGPGEIKGPGLAVSLSLVNSSTTSVDLSGITVDAAAADGTPASSNDSSPAAVPTGFLGVGKKVSGTWVFVVANGTTTHLTLTISSTSSADTVVIKL